MTDDTERCREAFESLARREGRSLERFDSSNPEHLRGTDPDGWPEFRVRDYFTWPTEEQWRAFRKGWLAAFAGGGAQR